MFPDVDSLPEILVDYHQRVVEQARAAHAAQMSWYNFLALRYQLQGEDYIDEVGRIIRDPKIQRGNPPSFTEPVSMPTNPESPLPNL